jgi:hypothetical protein
VAVGRSNPDHHPACPTFALGRGLKLEQDIFWRTETIMGMGRGLLLWMLGVPLPVVILLALFWR